MRHFSPNGNLTVKQTDFCARRRENPLTLGSVPWTQCKALSSWHQVVYKLSRDLWHWHHKSPSLTRKIHIQPYLVIVHAYSYRIQELPGFNLPDLTLRFFLKKTNRNLRFQIRIQYFKDKAAQINLLKNSFNNLELNLSLSLETTNSVGEA